jgi:hypothetical protein
VTFLLVCSPTTRGEIGLAGGERTTEAQGKRSYSLALLGTVPLAPSVRAFEGVHAAL